MSELCLVVFNRVRLQISEMVRSPDRLAAQPAKQAKDTGPAGGSQDVHRYLSRKAVHSHRIDGAIALQLHESNSAMQLGPMNFSRILRMKSVHPFDDEGSTAQLSA
jgi:hypothetical protein